MDDKLLTDDEVAMKIAGANAPDLFGHLAVAAMLICRTFPEPVDGRPCNDDLRGRMNHVLFHIDQTDTGEWPEEAIALCDAGRRAAAMDHPDLDEETLVAALTSAWPENLSLGDCVRSLN